MRQLYYILRTLVNGRGTNVIKTISLTLGLFVGILLFAKIAFEFNYNTDYDESENLYMIMADNTINGVKKEAAPMVMGPVANTIREAFPEEIQYATTIHKIGNQLFFFGDKEFQYEALFADSLFFQTMGITVLQGNVKDLANPYMIFISEETAKKTFGDESPVGKTLNLNKRNDFVVKGVFKKITENNTIRPDVVGSLQTLINEGIYFRWYGGDIYMGFVRLRPGADVERINPRISSIIDNHMEYNVEKNGWGVLYSLSKAKNSHMKNSEVRRRVMIMTVLGLSLLLIAALNYVLISISSLTSRAKGIGVHKCNGASTSDIFKMFIYETGVIISISLLLVVILIFTIRPFIEEVLETSIAGLFVWKVMWVPLVVVLILFLIAGVLPGRLFSRIPVTQVFRHYSESKQGWKRPLLFIQFAGVSFILGLLCIIMLQYQQVTTFNLGYQTEGLATTYHYFENREVGRATIANLPMVEDIAFSMMDIGVEISGDFVGDPGGKMLFSASLNYCDYNYMPLLGIKIKEGKSMNSPGQTVINEEYVRLMRWTDSPIGKGPNAAMNRDAVIVGVMENFVSNSLFVDTEPLMYVAKPDVQGCITVKLKEPYKESLKGLNESIKETFPTTRIEFTYMPDRLIQKYESTRRFRDMVLLAFIFILLITLMGLIGYVNDEVTRRSKEIAIRKVNGAEVKDILTLLSKGISWIALPSVAIGILFSYFVGKEWLMQFERFNIELSVFLFLLIVIAILTLIFGTVIFKSWNIANDDPVKSIKNE